MHNSETNIYAKIPNTISIHKRVCREVSCRTDRHIGQICRSAVIPL